MDEIFDTSKLMQTFVICSKHGEHSHNIVSTIVGKEGVWCQLCWLETLGPSLPYRKRPYKFKVDEDATT